MAVLVSKRVQQSVFVVDDALGKLDGGVVNVLGLSVGLVDLLSLPVCASSGVAKCLAPDHFDASGLAREVLDLPARDYFVECGEKVLCESCLSVVE